MSLCKIEKSAFFNSFDVCWCVNFLQDIDRFIEVSSACYTPSGKDGFSMEEKIVEVHFLSSTLAVWSALSLVIFRVKKLEIRNACFCIETSSFFYFYYLFTIICCPFINNE